MPRGDIEAGGVGSSFDDFLNEQGTYDETTKHALEQIEQLRVLWDEGIASGDVKRLPASFADTIKQRGRDRLATDP